MLRLRPPIANVSNTLPQLIIIGSWRVDAGITLMSQYNTLQFRVKDVYGTAVTLQSAMGKRQKTVQS